MREGKIGLIRFTSSLEISLYRELQQEMGLKSVIEEAPIRLGTRVRIVELTEYGRKPVRKKRLTQAMTSGPKKCQAALKNPEVRPSGPGALFAFNLNIIFAISSSDGSSTMDTAFSSGQRNVERAWNQVGGQGEVREV